MNHEEPHDYAPHMTALYAAFTKLGWALRNKESVHECRQQLVQIMREANRINEWLYTREKK